MPKGHALARRKTVRPRDLRDAHPISYSRISPIGVIVDDAFREHGETQHVGIEVRFCFSACTLVNASVGFAVVDEFTVCLNTFSNVETRPFKTTQRVTVSLSHAKQSPLSCLANIFVNEHLWRAEPAHAPRQPTGWIRIGYTGARINDSTLFPFEPIITPRE